MPTKFPSSKLRAGKILARKLSWLSDEDFPAITDLTKITEAVELELEEMIPLPILWKWLWTSFLPIEEGEEGQGLPKDELVAELLKEVGKEGNVQAGLFAKALIGRYLCLLHKNSTRCKTRFTDPSNPKFYTIKRVSASEKEERAKQLPPFPQDSRVQILKELREEKLGRTSARNLLQLMTQSPTKKARTGESGSSSSSSGSSSSPSSPAFPVPTTSRERSPSVEERSSSSQDRSSSSSQEPQSSQEKMSQDDSDSQSDKASSSSQSSSGEGGSEATAPPAPEPKERRGLKRAASNQELGTASSAAGSGGSAPSSPLRGGGASPNRREIPNTANAAASGHAAAYRALRKQVSSPALQTPVKNAPSVFYQQEPWKREINELWAKQLAMMREINTLKAEMGRREAARQREVLTLRQEIDLLRGELRNRPSSNGLKPPLPPPREDPSLSLKKTGSVMSLAAVVAAGEEEEKERAKEKEREKEKEKGKGKEKERDGGAAESRTQKDDKNEKPVLAHVVA